MLELIQFTTPDVTPVERDFFDPGSGHSRCGWRARPTHAALVAAGVAVRTEPIELDRARLLVRRELFYATDPDGVTVEIIERP